MPGQPHACLWTMWESKNIFGTKITSGVPNYPWYTISKSYVIRDQSSFSSPLALLVKGCLDQYCMSSTLNLHNNQFNGVFQSPVSWCPAHLSLDMSDQIFVVEILRWKCIKISEHFKPLLLLSYAKESSFVENDQNQWFWGPVRLAWTLPKSGTTMKMVKIGKNLGWNKKWPQAVINRSYRV